MSSMFRLVVCEKPSVARDVARVLGARARRDGWLEGEGLRVTWCLGHLVELAEPQEYDPAWKAWRPEHLPMLPEEFRLRPRAGSDDGAARQWRTVAGLLVHPELREVVNACDAGREGELIFAFAYELSGARAPVHRLWIRSMTDEAIRDGFARLRPGPEMTRLEAAARSRAEADWLVGLNATRAMTLRARRAGGDNLLSVGRVQTPTLAMLALREEAIERFRAEPFWQVKVRFGAAGGEWEGLWTEGAGDAKKDRFTVREEAEAVLARVRGRPGVVESAERKEERVPAPLLYDLTTLQKEANRRFQFTAQKTLDLAQSLYEKHKVLTYPRTDSRHLGSDQVPEFPRILGGIAFGPYEAAARSILDAPGAPTPGSRVIDDQEVADHHAIIPTGVDPRTTSLSPDEKRLYDLVVRRFLAVFLPDAVFATATVWTAIEQDRFVARGRTRLSEGWQSIDPPQTTKKEVLLPPVDAGAAAANLESRLHEGETQPPKRYNEATLLTAMERAGEALEERELKRAMKKNGLGTPATRAAIIETLLSRGFVRRRDRDLVPTPQGRALVRAIPVPVLLSPRLTGEWEARLSGIAEGADSRPEFMTAIRDFARGVVKTILEAEIPPEPLRELSAVKEEDLGERLGDCPLCGAAVHALRRGWGCRSCALRIPGEIAGREVSRRMAAKLLSDRRTQVVKGFRSRAGKPFDAGLVVEEDGRIGFEFPAAEPLGACPVCATPVRRRGKTYRCDTGRECPFVVFLETSGLEIPEEAVAKLLATGKSDLLEGFRRPDGVRHGGVLAWNGSRVEVQPVDAREAAGDVAPCPRCGAGVRFDRGSWRCVSCPFSIRAGLMQRDLRPAEVAELLKKGRTRRLHGFRQKNGAPCKAAYVLDEEGRLAVDFAKPEGEPPEPTAGGPPPAFGERVDCPLCVERGSLDPGWVVAGREAWGCSQWKEGCSLRVPFVVEGRRLTDEEVRRLFTRTRSTRYLSGFAGHRKACRVVLAESGWTLEEKR